MVSQSFEIWKIVPDWPYEVSSFGRVRRTALVKGTRAGQILKGGTAGRKYKYPTVILSLHGKHKTIQKHLLVSLAFLGPTPSGMEVDHKDGDRFNSCLDNLSFKTPSQNILGAVQRGHCGSNRWNAKLNEAMVAEMRELSRNGWSVQKIADKFNTNFTTTWHVIKRHNWKHVA